MEKYLPYIIALILVIISFICLLTYETIRIKITYYNIVNRKVSKQKSCEKGIKIIFFSDLHIGKCMKKSDLKKIVKILCDLNGDIYIFGGDLFGENTYKYFSKSDLYECFMPLKNKCMIAVYGNHEYRKEKNINMDVKWKLDFFNSMGCIVLKNQEYIFHKNGESLTIYGMNDYTYNNCKLPDKKYDLIICHEGDIIDKLNNQIMVSGHTHAGQIRLPFIPIYYRPLHGKKYTYGIYKENNNQIIVSSGIGYGLIKLRLFAPREIVCINYKK